MIVDINLILDLNKTNSHLIEQARKSGNQDHKPLLRLEHCAVAAMKAKRRQQQKATNTAFHTEDAMHSETTTDISKQLTILKIPT